MEKIFEDKEFHGVASFFKKVVANFGIDIYANGWNRTPLIWNSVNRFIFEVSDSPTAGTTVRNNLAFVNFTGSNTVNLGNIIAITGAVEFGNPNITVSWSGSRVTAFEGKMDINSAITLVAPFIGMQSIFKSASGGFTATDVRGHNAEFNSVGTGAGTIINYYGFFSDYTTKHVNTTVTNPFHFYGKGDIPSYFGGDVQQPVLAITASTPPTQAEMVSALGAASTRSGSRRMVSLTDGTINEVYSNGTSWYFSAYTIGA